MKTFFLLFSFSFIQLSVLAQLKAEKVIKTLDESFPQEKIHLFLNKEEFIAGETIWFKIYLFAGYVQSNISKTAYVELLNEDKQSIVQAILPLDHAVGAGSIMLPPELSEGNYYIRAYTKWMLNFDAAFQYIYQVAVYNPFSPKKLVKKPVQWEAKLFPESGTLLAGQDNKVVVRLASLGSLPESWQGYISEDGAVNKKLVSFSSINPQLATFVLQPVTGKKYQLHITDNVGNRFVSRFEPLAVGVGLKAIHQNNHLQVEMVFQGIANAGMDYKLVAVSQNQMFYRATIRRADHLVSTAIPVGNVPTGIVHLTLFDPNEMPVAERLVFIKTDQAPTVKINTLTFSAAPRGFNEWLLDADTSLTLAYAVALADADLTPPRNRSILSDLWLGDFTSAIDKPHWYFATDTFRLSALDALLVTEKWSRYQWKDILSGKFPQITYPAESYLTYKGIACHNGKALAEEDLSLMFRFKDSSLQFLQVRTNKQGEFLLENVAFYDSAHVYHPNNRKLNNVELHFERANKFYPYKEGYPHSHWQLVERKPTDTILPFVQNAVSSLKNERLRSNEVTLEEVKVKATVRSLKEVLNDNLSSPLFNTGNQTLFDFINEDQGVGGYTHILDWLEGRVAGLTFTVLDSPFADALRGIEIPAGERVPVIRGEFPTIYIDEMRTDVTAAFNLPVQEIALVKVIKGYFLGASGGGGGGGAIAIYTKRGGLLDRKAKRLTTATLVGYTSIKPFEEVVHAQKVKNRNDKDTRQQVYWNTQLFLGYDKAVKIRFYNNDRSRQQRIVITGFTKDAQPIFVEKVLSSNQ